MNALRRPTGKGNLRKAGEDRQNRKQKTELGRAAIRRVSHATQQTPLEHHGVWLDQQN
jgi:hypothetical protein